MIESLRHAFRVLRRDPVLWLTSTVTLALCIGSNTTVFSLVNSILIRPLPFPAADGIYWVSERMGKTQAEIGIGADYYSLREAHRGFAEVGAFDPLTVNWSGLEKPEQLDAAQVTPSFFSVLGTGPIDRQTYGDFALGVGRLQRIPAGPGLRRYSVFAVQARFP